LASALGEVYNGLDLRLYLVVGNSRREVETGYDEEWLERGDDKATVGSIRDLSTRE
jgi:hypothetical protein